MVGGLRKPQPTPCHHPIASSDPSSRVSGQLVLMFVRTTRPPWQVHDTMDAREEDGNSSVNLSSTVSSLVHSLYGVQSLFLLVPPLLSPLSATPLLAVLRCRCLVPGALQFNSQLLPRYEALTRILL
ncbi:uncharacterized protein TRIREDRAFT_106253 [Trichoderma reesei QM6a]|uniref:Predicted protein n=1 Tax=Hypocrea jecorina (strain QM6a) TaxID=431241 RepID=G0RHF5_HYPJQ|nr:uncharacterized protein TRIREDRAFT_106253 [Trichoderma reesei QM6a]EGR49278.1 predicted protein [Trichoderma reesei QM6a]